MPVRFFAAYAKSFPIPGMITGAFVWGFLSDIYGRKRILVIAFVMDTVLTVTFALAQSFLIFLAVKLFSGFM